MSINVQAARRAFQARLEKQKTERETARSMALQAVRTIAPAIIVKYASVKAAYLFGSILRASAFRPDSDIDIAVENCSAEDYFALWHDLEDALPDWPVDLRDLPANTSFTRQVYQTGEKIYG